MFVYHNYGLTKMCTHSVPVPHPRNYSITSVRVADTLEMILSLTLLIILCLWHSAVAVQENLITYNHCCVTLRGPVVLLIDF
jgi:hypothetical protein